jgi:hypothetical protein
MRHAFYALSQPEYAMNPAYKQHLKAAAKRKAKILDLHAKGESRNSIALKAQCSPQYVHRVISGSKAK